MTVPNPNSVDYLRGSEPFIGLLGKVTNETLEYFRTSESLKPLVFAQVVIPASGGNPVDRTRIRSRRTSW